MSEIQIAIWAAIGFFVGLKILEMIDNGNGGKGGGNGPGKGGDIEKEISDNNKIHDEIDNENYVIGNLNIKIRELENEIERLEIDSSTDFEKEVSNTNRIEKLKLSIATLDMKIEKRYKNIDNLKRELKGIY